MIKIFILATSWLILIPAIAAAEEQCSTDGLSEQQAREAHKYLSSSYPDGSNPGAAVLITCNGKTIFTHNGGMANIEWQQPISSNTLFRLGSISKPLTAVAILQLVEQGKINLDNPVSDYVALLPKYMRPVTVRQLMNHTSGLPDILLTPALLPLARDWVSKSQIIGMQANTPVRSAPGEKFEYSNFNYILLAALIEFVTDTKYSDYMDVNVFQALGMTRSHYDARRSILTERAQGYEKNRFGRLLNSENIDMSHASAAGALLSSANDLSKWSHLLISGILLKPETRKQAWSLQPIPNAQSSNYGLGFNIAKENGRRVIWHNGLASGFQAAFSMYPDHGLIVIVLSNGFHLPNTTKAMDQIADIAFGEK